MRKFNVLIAIGVILGSATTALAAQEIHLPAGASITLGEVSVSCQGSSTSPAPAPVTVSFTTCECRDPFNGQETLYQIKHLTDGSSIETRLGVYASQGYLGTKCVSMIQSLGACQ